MGSDWENIQLESCVNHQKGYIFKSKDYQEEGITIVRVSDFTDRSIDILSCNKIDEDKTTGLDAYKLQNYDVVIATVGSWPKNPASIVGKTIQVPTEADGSLLNQNAVRLRTNGKINQRFLFLLLKTRGFQNYIVSTAQGSANQASITLKDIFRFTFKLPPLPEQESIAHILGSLDDKIELNRQINKTLELMAQALFKSWFVDFDPVIDNALAAGNPIPEPLQARAIKRQQQNVAWISESAIREQNQTISKQFPNEFEFNEEMGWIPLGWESDTLLGLIELIGGGTPKTSVDEYWNGDIPWFSVVDAPNTSDVFVIDTEKHVTLLGVEKSSTKILPVGTTIISARGTVGKCAMVSRPMAMNQSCYGVRGKSDISDTFVYYMILLQVSGLQQRSHGSVFSTITRDTFKSICVPFGGASLTVQFDQIVKPYFDKILDNSIQSKTLTKLRDTLLPKLLSGEIRIPDAEKLIAEVS